MKAAFLALARKRFENLLAESNIFVLASHSKHILKNFCDKAIFLDKGKLVCFDQIDEAIARYEESVKLG